MDQPDLKMLAKKVLADAYVMTLAVADEDGPWAANIVYINPENLDLYWVSLPDTRHSRAIEKNPRAAVTVTAAWETDAERALQIAGVAEKLFGDFVDFEKILEKRKT